MESMLSARQVADLLGVHENWVYDQAARGELPSYKLGGTRRFDPEELRGWISEHRQHQPQPNLRRTGANRPKQTRRRRAAAAYAVRVAMAHVESYRLRDGARRYRARWVGADGDRAHARSLLKKDADRFVLEQQRRATLGALYQAPAETFGAFAAGWLDRYALARAAVDPRSHARGAAAPRRLRGRDLDEIRPAMVEDHVAAIARRAPRQAELALRMLKQVLANAKERGHFVDEAVFRIKAPRREQPEMRFLGWDEVEELAANTIAPYGNLVLLAALTGLRQGELFALRDRNIDLEGDDHPGRARRLRGRVRAVEDARVAPAGRPLQHGVAASCAASCSRGSRTSSTLVFPSPRGEMLNDDNFRTGFFARPCAAAA